MNAMTVRNAEKAQLGERGRQAAEWIDRTFSGYEAARDKDAARRAAVAEGMAYGIPLRGTTFYRRLEAWRKGGPVAALPSKMRRPPALELGHRPTRLPPGFVGWWQELCFQSQRVTEAAYRSLFMDHLIPGKTIPGYNTDWRGILDLDFPHYAGERDTCPFAPYKFTPKGWGPRNLADLAPSRAALTAARIGTAQSAETFMPKIPNTRAGLPFGSVWVMDDRHHDQLVTVRRNLHAMGVVELGALELLTAFYVYGMTPVFERPDETREMLREEYNRYLAASILCHYGISRSGSLWAGEHGTARMGDDLMDVIDDLTGDLVKFKAGGILNAPLAKGLWLGSAGGNPRWKAPLESIHGYFKNEMAMLPGSKGADPEHCPEMLEQQKAYHVSVMKAAVAIAADRPDIASLLQSPFPRWEDYRDYINLIYDRVNAREKHALEGWDACGFLQDYVLLDGPMPVPMDRLLAMPEPVSAAWRQVLAAEPSRHSMQPMSPSQAFSWSRRRAIARDELLILDKMHVPRILGPKLGQTLTVETDRTMVWSDPKRLDADSSITAVVQLPDGSRHPLPAGSEWIVHLSPFNQRLAWVSRSDMAYVGTCQVSVRGTKLAPDTETIAEHKRIESSCRREYSRIGQRRLADHAEMIGTNMTAFEAAMSAGAGGRQRPEASGRDDLGTARAVVDEMAGAFVEREDEV